MAKFKYKLIDKNGNNKTGTIESSSMADAKAKLSSGGGMVMNISVAGSDSGSKKRSRKSKSGSKSQGFSFGKVIKDEALTVFTRQVATLLEAGLPLLRSLEVMTRQEPNKRFKVVLEKVADTVKSGGSFSDALSQHPKIFDRLFVNMVKAGEAGGVLSLVLSRLAGFKEKALKTKKKVQSAMVYPFVVIGVAVSIVTLLMIVVVPKFQAIFNDMLDGAFYRDMDVTVIGGGDSACEEALFLTRFCSKVTLVHRRDSLRASKIMAERTLAHDKIEVCWNATPEAVLADDSGNARALQVKIAGSDASKEIPCKGVFIAIGHIPNTDFVEGLLDRDTNGYIVPSVGSQVRTEIDGLFAAGDCVDHVYRQAITAAGMGCQSAIETERWLAEKE